jgi:hypothetical protein
MNNDKDNSDIFHKNNDDTDIIDQNTSIIGRLYKKNRLKNFNVIN